MGMLKLRTGEKPPTLHQAVREGDPEAVRQALRREGSTSINRRDRDGFTPLHLAAQGNRADIGELLIGSGADVHAEGEGGMTPLHFASMYGNLEAVKLYVREGADVLKTDWEGRKASDVICAGVLDKRRRHAICGLLSLAEMKAAAQGQETSVEGHVTVESMLDRRLALRPAASGTSASESTGTSPASVASVLAAPSTVDSASYAPSVVYHDVAEDSMVDMYNGAVFLNDDVRQSASHLRLKEPLPGKHNFDIPYVNMWGD